LGTFRTILALLVVCAHLRPISYWPLVMTTGGAIFAVKAFFIVSGFYMALVLQGQYRDRPVRDFYLSRLMRLLPLYWIAGLATIAAEYFLVAPGQRFYWLFSPLASADGVEIGTLPIPIVIYAGVSLLTMFGMDTGQWLGFAKVGGAVGLAPDFVPGATAVMGLSPVPQAWSIGLELMFYLLAPSIIGWRLRTIALFAVASLGFRFGLALLGFDGDPWSRSLFPSELVFFLMGVAGFRLYLVMPRLTTIVPHIGLLGMAPITVALIISPIFNYHNNQHSALVQTLPYVLVAIGIPFLFDRTKSSAIDARIGDLSYPIYIGHLFCLGMLQLIIPAAVPSTAMAGWTWLVCNIAVVIIVAAALDRFIVAPTDGWRQRFGARAKIARSTRPVLAVPQAG
jgi:peptidoglycan/LPS O-acetylase OafA/YrhL